MNGRTLAMLAALTTTSGFWGCIKNPDAVAIYKAPERTRCDAHGTSSVRGSCDEAMQLAQLYVRRLAPGDEVCLEGGFTEEPGPACLARAAVTDVGRNVVRLQIRESQPTSRWFDSQMRQVEFEEGALVDLYLSERGY